MHPPVVPALAEYVTVPSYPAAQVHDPSVPVYPVAEQAIGVQLEDPAVEENPVGHASFCPSTQ